MEDIKFQLDREIVFFDLETTGLNIIRDRIVQIALIKYFPGDREPIEFKTLVNPGDVQISKEAEAVHGISQEMVADQPTFSDIADELYAMFFDADLGGYNSNRFDVPMLMEEFARAGLELDLSKRRLIDVQKIFYRMEPRTLCAALRFYCNKKLEGAHDALNDVRATVDVLKGQLIKYKDTDLEDDNGIIEKPIKNDMQALHDFTYDAQMIDVTQKLKYNDEGIVVFNFGKYINQPVAQTLYKDRNYYKWIMEKEFSHQVKKEVNRICKAYAAELRDRLDDEMKNRGNIS